MVIRTIEPFRAWKLVFPSPSITATVSLSRSRSQRCRKSRHMSATWNGPNKMGLGTRGLDQSSQLKTLPKN